MIVRGARGQFNYDKHFRTQAQFPSYTYVAAAIRMAGLHAA